MPSVMIEKMITATGSRTLPFGPPTPDAGTGGGGGGCGRRIGHRGHSSLPGDVTPESRRHRLARIQATGWADRQSGVDLAPAFERPARA